MISHCICIASNIQYSIMPLKDQFPLKSVMDGKTAAKKLKTLRDGNIGFSFEDARKRGEISIQIDITSEAQWDALLKREGLIVADVYSSWCGPCTSMLSILRQFKLETNEDRLIMATAMADNIRQLAPFRNQSEPTWLFIGGGKPVNVLRGSNAPKLIRTIKSELQHELECIAGKAKRSLISIKFEAHRREAAVEEAITLIELLALEEEERRNWKPPSPEKEAAKEEEMDRGCISICMKEKWAEIKSIESNEEEEEEEEEEEIVEEVIDEDAEFNEAIAERRRQMEESNLRLKEALRPFTVIAIQSYLLETGALTEIKDILFEDFKMLQERYINLVEEDARKLFGIPEEIKDPNPYPERETPSPADEESNEASDHDDGDDGRISELDGVTPDDVDDGKSGLQIESVSTSHSPAPVTPVPPHSGDATMYEANANDEGNVNEGDEYDEDGRISKMEREKTPPPPTPMIPLIVPEVLIGDTLILLLECTRVKRTAEIDKSEVYDMSVQIGLDADDYMLQRTGPEEYDIAVAMEPESLHALYGKEKYVAGVWCPRTFEDKRYVMLNYFPQFVTEMFTPPVPTDLPLDENDVVESLEMEKSTR